MDTQKKNNIDLEQIFVTEMEKNRYEIYYMRSSPKLEGMANPSIYLDHNEIFSVVLSPKKRDDMTNFKLLHSFKHNGDTIYLYGYISDG